MTTRRTTPPGRTGTKGTSRTTIRTSSSGSEGFLGKVKEVVTKVNMQHKIALAGALGTFALATYTGSDPMLAFGAATTVGAGIEIVPRLPKMQHKLAGTLITGVTALGLMLPGYLSAPAPVVPAVPGAVPPIAVPASTPTPTSELQIIPTAIPDPAWDPGAAF